MNVIKLKETIIRRAISMKELSERMDMSEWECYRKLNNYEKLTVGEVIKLKEILNLSNSEAREIFFTSNVAYTQQRFIVRR